MPNKMPIVKSYWLHKDSVYKVESVSKATDEVLLEDVADGKHYTVRFSLFSYAYERVFRVGEAAKLLGRSPRSIYRYEQREVIGKPKCYVDKRGRMVRYYRVEDLIDMHDLISMVHQGRPRKDGRTINNSMEPIGIFKLMLRERYGR